MEHREAVISACGLYRYALWRRWDGGLPGVLFVGLNPSTADGERDDPTLRRMVGFARRWGYGRVAVANLFGLRASDPKRLRAASDPVGAENDAWIRTLASEAGLVVAAWGNGGLLRGRAAEVLAWLPTPRCLSTTARGEPGHVLYLPAGSVPRPMDREGVR